MSDKIEQAIKEAGADVAPRITLSDIHGKIEKMDYIHHGLLTICVLTLQNGFTVTGESACASPENYNQTVGETIAYENAVEKIWPLEGYLLKQRLYESTAGDWKSRLVAEHRELHDKVTKLEGFLHSDKTQVIAVADRDLLIYQLDAMRSYYKILTERVNRAVGFENGDANG